MTFAEFVFVLDDIEVAQSHCNIGANRLRSSNLHPPQPSTRIGAGKSGPVGIDLSDALGQAMARIGVHTPHPSYRQHRVPRERKVEITQERFSARLLPAHPSSSTLGRNAKKLLDA
ncbi:hypothetical protein FHT77_003307 [Rhizobium sp. BK181]|uniref:hypothetical protein n=1 Tax=Rhizobium sp. BK181 TaxID=2587072 RepID=UPI00161F2304|nr:hypothetical protein [Rhizobium sp. BK181]MBB3317425.1 hypothetical protein [Rhizobium sp. BK181]